MDEAPKQAARLLHVGKVYTPKVRAKTNDKCHYCKNLGHWEQDCHKKKFDQRRKDDSRKKAHALVTTCHGDKSEEWFLDSGASFHMVNSDKFLYNKVELQAPIEVTIANGEKVLALYTGEITLEVTVNRNKEQVLLRNVLYSPQIQCNLLSEGRADDAGASITKSKGKCSIKHYETGETILTATKVGSLYQVNGHAICMKAKAMVASISHTNNLQKWHHRMGHISSLRLKQLTQVAEGVEVDKSAELPPCDDCALGKMTRAPFKTLAAEERHIKTLSRVHSDLYGPLEVQTVGGKQYAQIVSNVGSSWRKGY
jgi:hypothetical protein